MLDALAVGFESIWVALEGCLFGFSVGVILSIVDDVGPEPGRDPSRVADEVCQMSRDWG